MVGTLRHLQCLVFSWHGWGHRFDVRLGACAAIDGDEYSATSAIGPEPLVRMGLAPCSMHAVALDGTPENRCFAKLSGSAKLIVERLPEGDAQRPQSG
ncbi:hypothetical protein C7S17_3235 [Burkholderia thailandensis]|nr:hypothetical protein [Burkholderia thailandensis]